MAQNILKSKTSRRWALGKRSWRPLKAVGSHLLEGTSKRVGPRQTGGERYEARNAYTKNSETILQCNRCVRNRKINSQTITVCKGHVRGARITQNHSCQKALCNRCSVQLGNYFPNHKNCVCSHFVPSSDTKNGLREHTEVRTFETSFCVGVSS